MKIRSVRLQNFCKFDGTFEVVGIADGVNVLVGENELGKSTLLEAINGVIFEKAKSQTERVRNFRHFVNGTVPEVEMSFDIDGTRWTIRKRFAGQSGNAWLNDSTNRRFEGEAAETELQRLFGIVSRRGGSEPGIWGTLWVHQGGSFGDPKLDDAGRGTLQGCLEAQVGVVTGGQRGKKIPAAVESALEEIVSARGPRGKFKEAKDRLVDVNAQIVQFDAKRTEIFGNMDALTRKKRDLQDLQTDWDEQKHRQEIEDVRTRRTAAATRAAEIAAARTAAKLAEERAQRARTDAKDRVKLVAEIVPIEANLKKLDAETGMAEAIKAKTKLLLGNKETSLTQLRDQARQNGEQSRRLERIRAAIGISDEIERHEATLKQAADLQEKSGRLSEAIGRILATEDAVSRIATAETEFAGAKAALNAVATTVSLTLDPKAVSRVRLDGKPPTAPTVSVPVVKKTIIGIDGIGKIAVEPQIEDRDTILEQVSAAQEELNAALEAAGVKDIKAARQALAQRQETEHQLAGIRREIAGLAPKEPAIKLAAGLEARETRLRELRGQLKTELAALKLATLPTAAKNAQEISAAHTQAGKLDKDIGAAEAAVDGPKQALADASEALQELEEKRAGLRGSLETINAALAAGRAAIGDEALSAQVKELEQTAADQRSAVITLERNQGETVEAIDARIKRLEAAGRNHHDNVAQLANDITRLSAFIEASEGAGVEEALESSKAEQSRLEATVKGYEEEAEVLQLLRQTLREAEREAKALYLAPVVSRVEPYLKMLLPGTDIVLDENLAITAIKRNGAEETFRRLSDGTQEQIAVLTRIAFAELLLKQGRPATIILDDALAFSDDQRIERMFDILMRAGESVQIIVLTCRKRLFSRLGATTLAIRECDPVGL